MDGIQTVGGAISKGISRVGDSVSDAVNWIGDKVTDGLDFVNEKVVSSIFNHIPVVGPSLNDHIVQPGFGLLDTGVNFITNSIDSVVDFSTHALSGAADIATSLLSGDLEGAWKNLVGTGQTLVKDALGFVIESVVVPLKGIGGAINDMFNLTAVRGLRAEEQAYLETIYGGSLDYDEISIQVGVGVEGALGLASHAIGNEIFMTEGKNFDPDGSMTAAGLDLLAHEAGHVWQYQTDGASYIGDAVLSYGQSHIEQDDRNSAYEFTTAIEEMKPWNEMTPDEQAEIAMVIGEAYQNGGNQLTEMSLEDAIDVHKGSGRGKIELSAEQIDYLENIHDILRAG